MANDKKQAEAAGQSSGGSCSRFNCGTSRCVVMGKILQISAGLLFIYITARTFPLIRDQYAGKSSGQPSATGGADKVLVDSLSARFELFLRYLPIPAIIFVYTLQRVMFHRLFTKAVDPTSGNEHLVDVPIRILNNTFEQLVLLVVAQLCILVHLPVGVLSNLLVLHNCWFAIGRIAFIAGYPNKRGFGLALSFMPSLFLILFSLACSLGNCENILNCVSSFF